MRGARVPISAYRVQLSKDFRFLDARDLVPYLHALGIGDFYCPPRFGARRGSSHGYDVTDPDIVNSELGTETDFDSLCEKLQHYGIGLLLDIVPNHMVASHENPWWIDVLEHGPGSAYAHYFDINWHPVASKAAFLQENKVILPILGNLYGAVLKNHELSIYLDENGFFAKYYDHRLPLDPATYAPILERCAAHLRELFGADHPAAREIAEMRDLAASMPARTVLETQAVDRRREASAVIKNGVFRLYRDQPDARGAIETTLRAISDDVDLLHEILSEQAYRLAFWKIASEEMNYRRFFDINDLVCLRVEEPDVFERRHRAVLQLIREGKITGLRVDHIDGLYEPSEYLRRLQDAIGDPDGFFYCVVEKILGRDEPLPENWRTCGTTGYDFLNAINDVLILPDGLATLENAYRRFTGDTRPFSEICYSRCEQVMWKLFAGEVNTMAHDLGRLAALDRHARDVPVTELVRALVEVTACLPVYRTYIKGHPISDTDREVLERTLELARRRTTELEAGSHAFAFLRSVLLLEPPEYATDQADAYLGFVMRWQQFTGPVTAKGLEDTAFYVHNSLISRNEVGGDPRRAEPPLDLNGFHAFNVHRLARWPHTMNATSTHDAKRGEDVRARLNVISEFAEEWERCLERWSAWNATRRTKIDGREVPTPGEEVMIYQTMLGAWPLVPEEQEDFGERLAQFIIKAAREAKTYTGWIRPHARHEEALVRFAGAVLEKSCQFWPDFLCFHEKLAFHGALNGLSQVLLKITCPGVPDFYQGSELWYLNLVDPDNRRPVDFAKRIAMLERLRGEFDENQEALLDRLCRDWKDGGIKLYLTDKALGFRKKRSTLFQEGGYSPVLAAGERAHNVCAFARSRQDLWSLTVVPRWTSQLISSASDSLITSNWGDTVLPLPDEAPRQWEDVFSGQVLDIKDGRLGLGALLDRFPVALLEGVRE